jgi:DNA topoisomerase-1
MVSDFDAKSMQTKAGSVYAELLTDVKKTIAELGTTYSSLAEHGQSVVSGEAPAPTKPAAKKPAAKKTTAKKATAKKPAAKKATAKKTVTQTPVETVSQAKPDSE